jgi:hypothetical protein
VLEFEILFVGYLHPYAHGLVSRRLIIDHAQSLPVSMSAGTEVFLFYGFGGVRGACFPELCGAGVSFSFYPIYLSIHARV